LQADKKSGRHDRQMDTNTSSLSGKPIESYIVGYFQNSPDGSFQAPLLEEQDKDTWLELKRFNTVFNTKRAFFTLVDAVSRPQPAAPFKKVEKEYGLGAKYLRTERLDKQKSSLGREEKRVEEITIAQARNIVQAPLDELAGQKYESKKDAAPESSGKGFPTISLSPTDSHNVDLERADRISEGRMSSDGTRQFSDTDSLAISETSVQQAESEPAAVQKILSPEISSTSQLEATTFQVEVDPLQSVQLDEQHVFLFRRIVFKNKIYRQGLVLKVNAFLEYLGRKYFSEQPLSSFTNLHFSIFLPDGEIDMLSLGSEVRNAKFELRRTFPRPFSFINARLTCEKIPDSNSRWTLLVMMSVLIGVIFLGLFFIYQCAGVQVDLSQRRSGFVSSVTHELKTPLTNIRMYIEMLEQGIARDKEREKEYFRILGSESARLTRLINNVLEFSKLENKQRQISISEGMLDEVLEEVRDVMKVKLEQEEFSFTLRKDNVPAFRYEKEAMVQILINLIDNSIKFGRDAERKEIIVWIRQDKKFVKISVSDTGCGIPEKALHKVFDDFYRVDNSLTRKTSGTGIGLALVKKFCAAMGGIVKAENNIGPGCTVTVCLPVKRV
jgi:signal transduction histidine kinase